MKLPEKDGAVRLEVHAKPRAKKSRIVGVRDEPSGLAVDIALAAPPVDGAANEELVRFLAASLGLRRRDVELLRGEGSRTKLCAVRGIAPDELRAKLLALSSPSTTA